MPDTNARCDHYHEKLEKLMQDVAVNEQEHVSFRRRLNEHDQALKIQNGILVTLQKQGDAIETISKSLGRIETSISSVKTRVEKIEAEPAEKWKKLAFEVVKYVVLAAAGVAVGMVIKGA